MGRNTYTGIELTIGNNITLVGTTNYASDHAVQVQNGAVFTMKDNVSMSGNSSSKAVSISSSTFIMQDNAKITSYGISGSGSTITMSGSTSIAGGVSMSSSSNFTMSDNTAVSGGVSGSGSTFNMSNNASVTGGVEISSNSTFNMKDDSLVTNASGYGVLIQSNSKFTMQNNTKVFNCSNYGVYMNDSGNEFTMSGSSSVYGNTRGVYVYYGGSFTMQDNASVYGNTSGGGVYVYYGGSFTMKNNASVFNNTAGNGGGVYVYNNGAFTMSGGTIYGTNEPSTTLRNIIGGSGASLYVNSSGSATYGTITVTPGTGVDPTITVGTTGTVNVMVSYNINGGSGTTPASQTVSAGSSITLNNGSGLTKTGYTFGGWSISASASGPAVNNAGTSYIPTGNITLYAKWDNTLTAGTWKDGNIPSSNSEQWFRFTATAATQYIHVSFGTLNDLYVQVYDSNNNKVGGQTNVYGSNKHPAQSLTNGQVYFIKVWPYGSNSGTYKIAFNTSATAPAQ